jgi:hypothetical protein
MPRHGAIIFADLIGKLDLLRVSCVVILLSEHHCRSQCVATKS